MYDFISIDFETANSKKDSACSFGAVYVKDGEIVKEEYFLIKPPTDDFAPQNIKIHGLTYDDVKDAETFRDVWLKVKDVFKNELIISHNAHFDLSVVMTAAEAFGFSAPDLSYMDSINIFKAAFPDAGLKSLKSCAEFLGIELTNHHNALDDARACAQISLKSFEALGLLPILDNFSKLFRMKIDYTQNMNVAKEIPACAAIDRENFKISELKGDPTKIDKGHIFYNKTVVFTGTLMHITRLEASQAVLDIGGVVRGSVSKMTNYVVIGPQNKSVVGADGMSTKERTAYALLAEGVDIQILDEKEFLGLVGM